jgi:hypothetical protein
MYVLDVHTDKLLQTETQMTDPTSRQRVRPTETRKQLSDRNQDIESISLSCGERTLGGGSKHSNLAFSSGAQGVTWETSAEWHRVGHVNIVVNVQAVSKNVVAVHYPQLIHFLQANWDAIFWRMPHTHRQFHLHRTPTKPFGWNKIVKKFEKQWNCFYGTLNIMFIYFPLTGLGTYKILHVKKIIQLILAIIAKSWVRDRLFLSHSTITTSVSLHRKTSLPGMSEANTTAEF